MAEISVLLWCLLAGFTAGFTYDVFRLKRRIIKSGAYIIQIEDALFWIITTLIVLLTIQRSSDGEIRLYPLLTIFTGGYIYLAFTTKFIWKKINRMKKNKVNKEIV